MGRLGPAVPRGCASCSRRKITITCSWVGACCSCRTRSSRAPRCCRRTSPTCRQTGCWASSIRRSRPGIGRTSSVQRTRSWSGRSGSTRTTPTTAPTWRGCSAPGPSPVQLRRAKAATRTGCARCLQQTPDKVNQQRLQKSLDYYRQAVSSVPTTRGCGMSSRRCSTSRTISRARGRRSSTRPQVDDRFYPTYLLLGDVLTAQGDKTGGLAAYKKAAEISPKNLSVLSAVGIAGADAGDAGDIARRLAADRRDRDPGTRGCPGAAQPAQHPGGSCRRLRRAAAARRTSARRWSSRSRSTSGNCSSPIATSASYSKPWGARRTR